MALNTQNPLFSLSSLPLFKDKSHEFLGKIASAMIVRNYKTRETIMLEGTAVEHENEREGLCIIVRGRVEISVGMPPHGSLIVQLLYSGDIFGECAMTTGRPRNATATAAVPTRVLVLPASEYARLRATNPELTLTLHDILFAGLMQHQVRANMLASLCSITPLRRRLIKLITLMARPSGTDDESHILDHLTELQLGALLHVGRTAVSEMQHQLQKEGLIILERHKINYIRIPDIKRLQAALDASGPRRIQGRKQEQERAVGDGD